jgi:hypothetical protein
VPAKSIPALVDWTLKEAKLGQPKLSGPGKDADPLLVLTEAACERYGLPVALTEKERLAGRLPEGHKVIRQLARADWKLTKCGFGPWARIYRPAQGSERACVQLCIPSWHALYAADGPSPLDFLPYREGKPLPGGWRLGVNPGMVKWEGTQSVLWGEGVREQYGPELNLARYIKDGQVTNKDDGE